VPYTRYLLEYVSAAGVAHSLAAAGASTSANEGLPNWYEIPGIECLGAYQAKGVADYAASKVNKASPGLHDLVHAILADPTWDAVNGWTFDGTPMQLDTGIAVEPGESMSMFVQFSNCGELIGTRPLCGCVTQFIIYQVYGSDSVLRYYTNLVTGVITAGNLGFAGKTAYKDGVSVGTIGAGAVNAGGTIYIGGANGSVDNCYGSIQAVAIYRGVPTAEQVATLVARMQHVGETGTYANIHLVARMAATAGASTSSGTANLTRVGFEAHGTSTSSGSAELRVGMGLKASGASTSDGSAAMWISHPDTIALTQVQAIIDVTNDAPLNLTQHVAIIDANSHPPVDVTQAALQMDVKKSPPIAMTQAALQLDVIHTVPIDVTAIGILVDGYTIREHKEINCWEVHVYDRIDKYLTMLHMAYDTKYMETLNEAGSGSFRIYVNDPKATATNLRYGNVVRLRYKNIDIGAFVIENVKNPLATAEEVAGRILEVSGRGLIGMLDKAQIYPTDMSDTKTGTRTFEGVKRAEIFLTLWHEFLLRGGGALHTTFNTALDSAGLAWSDTTYKDFKTGRTMLDVMTQLAALGTDFKVWPDKRLDAYMTLGVDRHESVVFEKGWNVTKADKETIGQDVANVVLAEGQASYLETADAATMALYGRQEGYLSVGDTSNIGQLGTAAAVFIARYKAPYDAIKLTGMTDVYFPFLTYGVGDTVRVVIPGEFTGNYRIISIAAHERTGPCDLEVELELNSAHLEYISRLERALRATVASVKPQQGTDLSSSNTSSSGGVPTGSIGSTHISWGTAAGQVNAGNIPIIDTGNYFPVHDVESALQYIGSVLAALSP
jgi:hypothetical protein